MSIDFSVTNQQAAMFNATAQSTVSAAATGVLLGHAAAQVATPQSILADAAEELSFAVDTTDEFELEERKERDKIQKGQDDRVRLYEELMHQAGKTDEMNQLKQSLKAEGNRQNIANSAQRYFSDDTDAYVALMAVLQEFEQDDSIPEDTIKGIKDVLKGMEEEKGASIRAGMQGALSAAGFEDVAPADELRDLYRQSVCEFSSVNDAFAFIHEKYGDTGFPRAMDYLFSSLSADLASDVPSMEKTHLESVHGTLSQVRLLQSAHTDCERLLERWENVHDVKGVRDGSLKPMDLLGDIVALRNERFLSARNIESIVQKAKAPDLEREVLFLQDLLAMTRSFPTALFDGAEGRMKVLEAVQEAVDNVIAREDEYYANLENE